MEIPLEMELKRSYSRKPDADEAELEAQVTRLLVMKNKKGKEFYAYMHIMAESGYLAECGYKLHGNRYKNIQDGFTGHIYYTRPDGGYNNGWTYANGRITGKLAKLGNGSGDASALAKNQVRDMICITYTWVEWEQHCVVTYPSGNVSCGPWHIVSQFVLWEECYGSGN
ncbi:MAG: hypothetical protein LBL90_01635, partial [Prevotellaceae bacterium]|nr:hypothetical protein [Prevotellaceae bacterium]